MTERSSLENGRAWPGLAAGLVVSLLLHVSAGAWLVRNATAQSGAADRNDRHADSLPTPPDQPVRLGQIDADRATITWLGVQEDAADAEAPESEVDQAALSPNVGSKPTPDVAQEPVPVAEQQEPLRSQDQPAGEPAEEAREPISLAGSEQAEASPATLTKAEPIPIQSQPAESFSAPDDLSPGPSLVAEPNLEPETDTPAEPTANPTAEPLVEPEPVNPDAVVGPPAPKRDTADAAPAEQQPSPAPNQPQTQPQTSPAQQSQPGERAVQSTRESDASMRKRAIEYRSDLNRPLAGKGLEIKTVRPQWPVTVRQSYRPRNPHMVIHFGADGRVKRVAFIREADSSKGTGIPAVDQPLIDALYRWTAKGSQIDGLDASDPGDLVTVPIRILLSGR